MGILSYFRKIITDYPDTHFWKDDMSVDNLLIDFNSMIYQVINILNDDLGANLSTISPVDYENKLITGIIKYLQHIVCEVIRPKKSLYIACDGPPPMAKMIQQRARRYKTIKEQNFKKELEKKYKVNIPTVQWNKCAISPGTSFMVKLSKIIIQNINKKNLQLHNENLIVIFSDDSVPGEGEHKLLPSIKRLKSQTDDVSVIYSPDADLIVLTVMSGVNKLFILREPKNSDIELQVYKNHEFLYLNIDRCREEFCNELNSGLLVKGEYYKEILKDYSFLTFLCGNDFVIAAPFLRIKEGGIQLLIDSHKDVFAEINSGKTCDFQFLISENNKINCFFLMKLLKCLTQVEEEKLKKWQKKRDKIRNGARNSRKEDTEKDKQPWELELSRFSHEEYYSPLHPHFTHLNKVFDKIDYYDTNWNEQYNKHFFGIDNEPSSLDKVCLEYYKSMIFCLKYYYEGVPSWDWFYPYRAAPSIKQFCEFIEKSLSTPTLDIEWECSSPCTQFEQLMYILPKNSFKLLPKVLAIGPDLDKYYPKNFILDIVHGTKFIYSEPILPEIPMEVLKNKISQVYDKFSPLEKERNTLRSKPYVYKIKS